MKSASATIADQLEVKAAMDAISLPGAASSSDGSDDESSSGDDSSEEEEGGAGNLKNDDDFETEFNEGN